MKSTAPLLLLSALAVCTSECRATPRTRPMSSSTALLSALSIAWQASNVLAYPDLTKRDISGSSIWVVDDVYQGESFFDQWDFWNTTDPTHGSVTYVNRDVAVDNKLIYVTPDGRAIMRVDNTTTLANGVYRESVRISSKKKYNHGLFILDVERVPFGCGVWPAFWTNGYYWPAEGEIDIIEGVHNNSNNQVAWHTEPGCYLTNPGNFTGQAGLTDCNALINYNSGCAIRDPSRTSYGDGFRDYGGGVYAMKWDEQSIDVWFFYRATIPDDIKNGAPDSTQWGLPSASLSGSACPIDKYFMNHMIVFDTTLCGDWAGSQYPSFCPGTCADAVMDPKQFDNAYWSINSLLTYKKATISGRILSSAPQRAVSQSWISLGIIVLLSSVFVVTC